MVRLILAVVALQDPVPAEEGVEFFERRIRPLLVERCLRCHGAGAREPKGGLTLDTREGVRRGGSRGPAVVPGEPDRSLLLQAVRRTHESLRMPPDDEPKLSDEQIGDLERWIRMGAPDPRDGAAPPARPKPDLAAARRHWSIRPVADPPLPPGCADPIEALLAPGVEPAPEADRLTLVRRATFDLTGLPPTPEEIDAFLADDRTDAFARLVERLLASPHYGERWGRRWLDLVRYADTSGDNSDYPVPQLFRYRDYVIDAFNRDLPYDRFVREQIAGDLLPHADAAERRRGIVATGYLAGARRFGSQIRDYPQHLTIEDTIDNLGRAFLGLTLSCARCHDHKYDAVTVEDYYALYGIFESTRYPFPGIELDKVPRDLVPLLPPEQLEALVGPYREKLAAVEAEQKALEEELKRRQAEIAEAGADKARATAARRRISELDYALKQAAEKRRDLQRSMPAVESAYAVAEGKAGDAVVQIRGEPKNPGARVPRRFLELLGGRGLPAGETGSGRRALADWIADPANPLTARVMVNRIWQGHFGRGLVPTPNDFGVRGQPPAAPELLDWLAARFVEEGWSIKAMHRRIMLSRAYRRSTAGSEAALRADPTNARFGRFERRRLEAEEIRDAILAVSGSLDRTPGGEHPFPHASTWTFTQHKPFLAEYEHARRSVYLMNQRIQRMPLYKLFDGPDPNASTPQRAASTTPLQALFLMNDPFVHEQARRFAARLIGERADSDERIERAHRLALGRPPTSTEREAARAFLAAAGERAGTEAERLPAAWEAYARVLFCVNEFVILD